MYLFPLFLPYMFRPPISPSAGVSQAVFLYKPFGSCGVYVAHLRMPVDWFVVVVSLYWCRGGCYQMFTTGPTTNNNTAITTFQR